MSLWWSWWNIRLIRKVHFSTAKFWKKVAEKFDGNEFLIGYLSKNNHFSEIKFCNPHRFVPFYVDRHCMMSI